MTLPTSSTSPTRRRGQRREVILEAAAGLFAERGYPATGIDEIGAAAGITGPGVYRHFENKTDVLGEIVQRALAAVVDGVERITAEDGEPWAVLEALAANLARTVLADRASWAVLVRERRHLDADTGKAFGRAHRRHVEAWERALAVVRPELSDAERRVLVHGVLGAIAPYAGRTSATGLDDEQLVALLTAAAMRVLRGSGP